MFPKCKNYSDVYDVHGLLNDKTIMAHGVYLSDEELELFQRKGADVSGGYSPSILDAVRRATDVSNILSLNTADYQKLSHEEVFRLATLGGSKALGLEKVTGNFEVGKDFDAVLVNTGVPGAPFDVFHEDTLQAIFQKFLFLGDDRNMTEIYVAGKQVLPCPTA